jgi:hypothetical protein
MSGDATRGPRGLTGRPLCFQVRLGPQFPSLLFIAKKQELLELLDAQAPEVSNSVSLSCSDCRGVCPIKFSATYDEKAGNWLRLFSSPSGGLGCLPQSDRLLPAGMCFKRPAPVRTPYLGTQ